MKLKTFLFLFGIVAIALTIFPFISVDHWSIRVFDFPHLQLTLFTLLALLTYFLRFEIRKPWDYFFVVVLTGCFLFQSLKIYPYTAFSGYEVFEGAEDTEDSIKIYTANVLQENHDYEALINDAQSFDADLMVFTETDRKWAEALHRGFADKYKYSMEVPLDNTYGMQMFSKFELYGEEVVYLVEDTIPSMQARIVLASKDTVQLFAIHPAPPTPQHNPSSVDRDAEMMKIAYRSHNSEVPVIVLGDFNDVAWSETTSLFQKASGLLDLRKGRGFYSTFNAKNWLMRWPLDHIFTSPEFRILDVQLGANVGSDHFPFYTHLSFEPGLADEQRLPPPSKEILQKAFEQIENEKEKDSEE